MLKTLSQTYETPCIMPHVVSNPDISDHRLLRCKIAMKAAICYRSKSTPRFNIAKLSNQETYDEFQTSVSEHLNDAKVLEKDNIEDIYILSL